LDALGAWQPDGAFFLPRCRHAADQPLTLLLQRACCRSCIIYAIFGNSKQLSVGPVAVTSLLIGNGMAEILPCESSPLPSSPCAAIQMHHAPGSGHK
jgi:hypothetical protein